jgi:hypothetical protein
MRKTSPSRIQSGISRITIDVASIGRMVPG